MWYCLHEKTNFPLSSYKNNSTLYKLKIYKWIVKGPNLSLSLKTREITLVDFSHA